MIQWQGLAMTCSLFPCQTGQQCSQWTVDTWTQWTHTYVEGQVRICVLSSQHLHKGALARVQKYNSTGQVYAALSKNIVTLFYATPFQICHLCQTNLMVFPTGSCQNCAAMCPHVTMLHCCMHPLLMPLVTQTTWFFQNYAKTNNISSVVEEMMVDRCVRYY